MGLPDWVVATNNRGTVVSQTSLAAGASLTLDVSPYQSVVVRAETHPVSSQLCYTGTWYPDTTLSAFIDQFSLTTPVDIGISSNAGCESPVKGGALVIKNNGATAFNLTVTGFSRVVSAYRVLPSNIGAKRYTNNVAFVAGTQYALTGIDVASNIYAANGTSTINTASNTAGTLYVVWVDYGNNQTLTPIQTVAAAGFTTTQVALPQQLVSFVFIPSAPNAAGGIILIVTADQV